MATRTATAAQAGVSPKGLKVGLVAVASLYSIGASHCPLMWACRDVSAASTPREKHSAAESDGLY